MTSADPLDKSAGGTGSVSPATTANTSTTTAASELLVAAAAKAAAGTWGAGSGYSHLVSTGAVSSGFLAVEDRTVAALGAYAASFTLGIDVAWAAALATFKAATGPLIDRVSDVNAGFVDVTDGTDTDPFDAGDQVSFTVQAADTLTPGTYYWRVRAKDPTGSGTYGAWSETRSFTITAGTVISP
jgi:hypothetical protein